MAPSPYDDPLGFVLTAPPDQVPVALVQAVTQNALRGLLSGFLHEPPLAYWYRHACIVGTSPLSYSELFSRLLPLVGGVTNEECRVFGQSPDVAGLGNWVAALYRVCARVLSAASGPEFEAPATQPRLSCPLPWAVRKIAQEFGSRPGLRLVLHGSLATCDTTAYSDVDTLLFVSHDWLATGERLLDLRRIVQSAQRWLYQYDPLQHHGFMLVSELDLARYARWYFPLELLSHAYALNDGPPIRYRVRDIEHESVSAMRRLCGRLERLERGETPMPTTRYALKTILSDMMLLPTYYLQLVGTVMYKRDSFGAVRDKVSPRARRAIDALSSWRREWRRGSWEDAYRSLGPTMPRSIAQRVLARARAASLRVDERSRWEAILPDARTLGSELLQLAEIAA